MIGRVLAAKAARVAGRRELAYAARTAAFAARFGAWRLDVLREQRAVEQSPPDTPRATAILLSYKRPENIDPIVRALLASGAVERLILSSNNPEHRAEQLTPVRDPRILLIDQPRRTGCGVRYLLAREHPAERYFFIDDDLFLSPRQIRALIAFSAADTTRAHGIFGHVRQPRRHHFRDTEREVDVISRVYAFGAELLPEYFRLHAAIGAPPLEELSNYDDLILSFAGQRRPRCHAVGGWLDCPTGIDPAIAVWRDSAFERDRDSAWERLRAAKRSPAPSFAAVSARPRVLLLDLDLNGYAGVEAHTLQLARALHRRGVVEVTVASTRGRPLAALLGEHGLRAVELSFPDRWPAALRRQYLRPETRPLNVHLLAQLARVVKEVRPDIVQLESGWLENLLLQELGVPIVQVFHGSAWFVRPDDPAPGLALLHRAARPAYRWMTSRMAERVFVSHAERARALELGISAGPEVGRVIYNAVDPEELERAALRTRRAELRARLGAPEGAKVVLFAGRLQFDKSPEVLARVIPETRRTLPPGTDLHLWIAGKGGLAGRVRSALAAAGIEHLTSFLGFRDDVPALIAASDATLSTSGYESFGLTAAESLALGCPPLGFRAGGLVELLGDGPLAELLAPRGEPEELGRRLAAVLSAEPTEREARAAQCRRRAAWFSPDRQAEAFEAVYLELCQEPRPA